MFMFPSQSCVLSLFSLLLLTIGSICMLTDALGKPVSYITAVILEMITNTNTNNVAANEHFLDHMYRIVSWWNIAFSPLLLWLRQVGCCGAYGESDYRDHNMSPPASCVDR